jgi:hypothetical protein
MKFARLTVDAVSVPRIMERTIAASRMSDGRTDADAVALRLVSGAGCTSARFVDWPGSNIGWTP